MHARSTNVVCRNIFVGVLSLFVWLGVDAARTGSALACSPDRCVRPLLFPASGQVPSDQLRFAFEPARDLQSPYDAGASPTFYRVDSTGRTQITMDEGAAGRTRVLLVRDPLPAGTRIVAEAEPAACAPDAGLRTEYVVTEARPVPSMLGTLEVSVRRDALQVAVTSGSCHDIVDAAYADLTLTLSEAARPFADVLTYTLLVDDAPASSFSGSLGGGERLERGRDRIYAVCERSVYTHPTSAVSVGTHQVRMIGTLPKGGVLETPAVEVKLHCGGSRPAAWVDAGIHPRDAGFVTAEGALTDHEEMNGDGGCSMPRSRHMGTGQLLWCCMIALAVLLRRSNLRR